MKKHMNMVELTRKQQDVVRAGTLDNECKQYKVLCVCASSQGHCSVFLKENEGEVGCAMPT